MSKFELYAISCLSTMVRGGIKRLFTRPGVEEAMALTDDDAVYLWSYGSMSYRGRGTVLCLLRSMGSHEWMEREVCQSDGDNISDAQCEGRFVLREDQLEALRSELEFGPF